MATTCQFERKLGNVGKTLGAVIGTYTVESSVCRFDVEKKPRVVPRALIERVFDEFMGWGDPDERWAE